jgi:signal transduction histidine kinase
MNSPRTEVADAAHDLSNACATLLGFAMLATESAQPGTPLESYLGEVLQAARTAAGVAERLRALSDRLKKAESAGTAATALTA